MREGKDLGEEVRDGDVDRERYTDGHERDREQVCADKSPNETEKQADTTQPTALK